MSFGTLGGINIQFLCSLLFFGLASGLFAEPELKSFFNGKDPTGWKALKGKFKYVCNLIEGEMEELYDLTRDPEELNNRTLMKHSHNIEGWRRRNSSTPRHRLQATCQNHPRSIEVPGFIEDARFR